MTKMSIQSRTVQVTGVAERLLPPSQRDGNVCDYYAPGHQFHYSQQLAVTRSPQLSVSYGIVDGTTVTLLLADGTERRWRHHDPQRLRRHLELMPGRCTICPDLHALRVGPYWFNCAGEQDEFRGCATGRPAR